jgi:intein/homing endonuclease
MLNISGSLSEDKAYYEDFINKIFFNLFNTNFKICSQRNDELIARLYSKAIAQYFNKLGVKSGKKVDNNCIPRFIFNSDDEVKKSFIRGVFDTEGSMTFKKDYFGKHSKPIITMKMKSRVFVEQMRDLLEYFGFSVIFYPTSYLDKRSNRISKGYKIELAGKKNLAKYTKLIDFRNPRHLTKVEIWKKYGFYPPRLNYKQRKDVLSGTLNIKSVYFI